MKLDKTAAVLLACSVALGPLFAGCKSDDNKEDSTSDTGDGDGDGDEGASGDGDGDGDRAPLPNGPQCDEEGGAQCTGSASGIVCADGSTDGIAFTCATGEICADGACVGQCDPGATECVGGSVQRVCTSDGREWVNVPCQSGQVCEDGACGLEGGLVCVPGETQCDGNTALTCKKNGSGWNEVDCPGSTVCDDGMCEGTVCTVGATKCDDSTTFSAAMFEGSEPNFSIIHRCVDGERWVAEPCPSSEEVETVCTYDNFSRTDAARYRLEVNLWVFDNFFEGPPDFGSFPTMPEIPAGMSASCKAVPDDSNCDNAFDVFFETPAMTRECADPNAPADEKDDKVWAGYTECHGLPPLAPLQIVNNECSGASVCLLSDPARGCSATDCRPGESTCASDDTYNVCVYEGDGTDWSFFECPSAPAGGAGVCTEEGEVPSRQAACNGTDVDPEAGPIKVAL